MESKGEAQEKVVHSGLRACEGQVALPGAGPGGAAGGGQFSGPDKLFRGQIQPLQKLQILCSRPFDSVRRLSHLFIIVRDLPNQWNLNRRLGHVVENP
jgi:hypothetical protein